MISSDGARTGVVLLVVVGGLLPFALSCGVEGDLGRLGCPPGETCAPAPISFHVAEVSPCTWDAFPRRRSRAVAFGGTTRAEPTSAVRTEWSAHFAPATTGRLAVAVALFLIWSNSFIAASYLLGGERPAAQWHLNPAKAPAAGAKRRAN